MQQREVFVWSNSKEPHHDRRIAILKDHPEVKTLFGQDPALIFKTIILVILHLATPIFLLPENPFLYGLLLFFVGATISHVLFLAIHEITHDLAFRKKKWNNILAIVANFPLVFPYAMAFREYHSEHHWHQGKQSVDTDVPSEQEALIFKGFFGKLIWLINQILFYAIRPLAVYPKKPNHWQVINFVVQIGLMIGYFHLVGWAGLIYLTLSIFIAGGLHPIAGHFIAEHYVFKEGQETYSYYGPLNAITFNVGYHNEHHDFPNIPGSRLPELRKLAPDYYDNLYAHKSWLKVLWKFVSDSSIGLHSRVKRNQ